MDALHIVIAGLVALMILVPIHEFGHYSVARLCGVKVFTFCVGLGKPIWSFRDKHGTEFGIAAIPLGGYVKMLGEHNEGVSDDEMHMSFKNKPIWQRISILAAGPVANLLLAVLIFWGVFFFYGTKGASPMIGEVELDSIAYQAGLRGGQEIVSVDGVATPTRVEVQERLFMRLGESGTLKLAVREGSDLQSSVQEAELELDQWMKGVEEPNPIRGLGVQFYTTEIQLGTIDENGSGAEAGLEEGDILISADGRSFSSISSFIAYIQPRYEQELTILVKRDGEEVQILATPRRHESESGDFVGLLGVGVGHTPFPRDMIRIQRFGFFEAWGEGVKSTKEQVEFYITVLKKLVVREISTKNLSGPIGIAKVASDYAKAGPIYYLEFLALLSVVLGVMNLLPIPILDGGQIVYCLIEAVKGSPLSQKFQLVGFCLGLALLGALMSVAFYNDILRL